MNSRRITIFTDKEENYERYMSIKIQTADYIIIIGYQASFHISGIVYLPKQISSECSLFL